MGTDAIDTFLKYMGTGLTVIWFLLALLYLFLNEKRKPRRILFVYVPMVTLLLFFNPLFSRAVCLVMGSEVYFRTCWLLPVIVVIAYCGAEIAGRFKGRRAFLFGAVSLLLVMVSGKLVYSSPLYSKAENIYHVPQEVVEICDAIRVPGREVMAAFPREMLLYVRQYSPYVCMPYGREAMMGVHDAFYEAMEEAEEVDLEIVEPLAREAGCHFLVLPKAKPLRGDPDAYGWTVFMETQGYVVYRDNNVELVIP